jgi:hypothetical protein
MAVGFIPGGKIATTAKLGLAAPARQAAQVLANGTRGGIGPVLKGQAGVDQVVAGIEAAGGTILGREVTVKAATMVGGKVKYVKTRFDLFVELPCGTVCFLEVKNGWWARLTRNQRTAFPIIRSAGGIPVGNRAEIAGLPSGVPIGATQVWEVWLNKW